MLADDAVHARQGALASPARQGHVLRDDCRRLRGLGRGDAGPQRVLALDMHDLRLGLPRDRCQLLLGEERRPRLVELGQHVQLHAQLLVLRDHRPLESDQHAFVPAGHQLADQAVGVRGGSPRLGDSRNKQDLLQGGLCHGLNSPQRRPSRPSPPFAASASWPGLWAAASGSWLGRSSCTALAG